MKHYKIYQSLKKIFLVNFTLFFLVSENAFALGTKVNGVERVRTCDANGNFEFEKLFEPYSQNGISLLRVGNEMDFNLKDPICLTEVLANYLVIKTAILGIATACGTRKPMPHPAPIDDFKILATASYKAITNTNCRLAFGGAFIGSVTSALLSIGAPYETAKAEFKRVRICGSDWLKPDPAKYDMTKKEGSYSEYVEKNKTEDKNKKEYLYGGKEFSDATNNPDETCIDPETNAPQKYYLRGLQPGNYNCEKYNPAFQDGQKKVIYKKAYDCCREKRKKYVCLEKYGGGNMLGIQNNALNVYINFNINSEDVIFCKAGTKCNFKSNQTSVFEAFYRDNKRLICAKSTSFCPFNFSVGGGSPFPDYLKDGIRKDGKFIPYNPSNEDCKTNKSATGCQSDLRDDNGSFKPNAGKLSNYCQYYTHCTSVDNTEYSFDYGSLTPYFSKACINFIGDSQNGKSAGVSSAGTDYISSQNHFSAPIVQCIKETMENVFYNKAGHSRCLDGTYGDTNNLCFGDSYKPLNGRLFKKGNKVNNNSHFEVLQGKLKSVITGVLIISLTFFGVKILMMNLDIQNKKEILVYLIKIAIVIYFVNGTAWRDVFFDGIYNGSAEISKIFFKIKPKDQDNEKCNFGALYDEFGNQKPTDALYPTNARYLRIWDTLDCKIMQYLNYGPGLSSSTIMMLIVAFFFTGGIGIVFFTAILVLAVCLISVVIRAMHIFIASSIAIIIYVFISPIIIPLLLFERTKSIFDTWLNHLMSFSLQPIILFSYIAIFISLSEYVMYDKARYDDGKLLCQSYCLDENGAPIMDSNTCKTSKKEMYDPKNTTPACILGFNDFNKNSTFAIFGIGLIGVNALFDGSLNVKLILIIKTAVFLFALAQMMDQIPDITSNLIGENIDAKSFNYIEMMKKLNDALKGTQKRLARFTQLRAKGVGKKFQKDDDGTDSKGGDSNLNQNSSGGEGGDQNSSGS